MNDFNDFQAFARSVAIYRDEIETKEERLRYAVMGMAGEVGELANKIKKRWRDGSASDVTRRMLVQELGDVLWYVAMAADELDCDLYDVAAINQSKLLARKNLGTLQGSGDNR